MECELNGKFRTGFIRRIWQAGSAALMTFGAVAGIGIATATPAQAEGSYTYYHPVYVAEVCQHQGHTGASTFTPWNPYTLYCYDLSIPAGLTFAGDLNVQEYCDEEHPGSVAVVYGGNSVLDWKCAEELQP